MNELLDHLGRIRGEIDGLLQKVGLQQVSERNVTPLEWIWHEAGPKQREEWWQIIADTASDDNNMMLLSSDREADLKAYALKIRHAVEPAMLTWARKRREEEKREMARHWPDDLPAGTPDPEPFDEQFEGGRR